MGFKSFLSAVGHGGEVVLKFLASDRGKRDVQIAEGGAVTVGTAFGGPGVGAGIAGIELLVNKGLFGPSGVLSMEATAATLGAQSGTGLQKGAAVAAGLTPFAEQLVKDLGYDSPKAEVVDLIASTVSKALADIVNVVPPPATNETSDAQSAAAGADIELPVAVMGTGANAKPLAPSTGMVASR